MSQLNKLFVLGIVLNFLASFLISLVDAFVKILTNKGNNVFVIIFYRSIIEVLLLIIYSLFCNYKMLKNLINNLTQIKSIILCLRFIFRPITAYTFFSTFKYLSISEASSLFSIHPIISVIFGYIFFKEKISKIFGISLFLSIIGILLISKPWNINKFNSCSLGYLFSFLSSITLAINLVIIRFSNEKISSIIITLIGALGCVIFSFVYEYFVLNNEIIFIFNNLNNISNLLLLILGFVSTFSMSIHVYASQIIPNGYSSLIRVSEIVFSYILQLFIFSNSKITYLNIIGSIIIILSVLIVLIEKLKIYKTNNYILINSNDEIKPLKEKDIESLKSQA